MAIDSDAPASTPTTPPPAGAPPADTACDLVMKGGITSGVIYPRLISRLAAHYRFANIGGTSAGAIAAGACAAAEYRRQRDGGTAGFDQLESLPELLGGKTTAGGRSRLFTLFQPTWPLRRHFAVLMAMLNKAPREALTAGLGSMLAMYPPMLAIGWLLCSLLLTPVVHAAISGLPGGRAWALATVALAMVTGVVAVLGKVAAHGVAAVPLLVPAAAGWLAVSASWMLPGLWGWRLFGISLVFVVLAALLLALLLVAVVARFGVSLLRGLHANGYGVCSGLTSTGSSAEPGLTDWLTAYLNDLAGLPEGRPLQFCDLWGTSDPKASRKVNLEVMTSAVSQRMIYGIPFRDRTPRFFYDPDAWKALFPDAVMRCLQEAGSAHLDRDDDLPAGTVVVDAAGKALRALPRSAELPVVVAVRMSLSFPVLLSAVPLHTIDWSLAENRATKDAQRKRPAGVEGPVTRYRATKVWFSDGGIGSNMPLHMFDALLPGHPTFAVNLKDEHPDFRIQDPEQAGNNGGRIYLPKDNLGGRLRHFAAPADGSPLTGLAGFLWSIVSTMQNWRDEIMFPYPGFRDRIVQISQRPHEGGLNLDMPEPSIAALSRAGAMAAERLIDRFHVDGAEQGKGWQNHQALRLGTFLGVMQPASCALHPSLVAGLWQARVADIAYDSRQRRLAQDCLETLKQLGQLGAGHAPPPLSLEGGALKPLAQIRISPRI